MEGDLRPLVDYAQETLLAMASWCGVACDDGVAVPAARLLERIATGTGGDRPRAQAILRTALLELGGSERDVAVEESYAGSRRYVASYVLPRQALRDAA